MRPIRFLSLILVLTLLFMIPGTVQASQLVAGASHDGDVWFDNLRHDSRDALYRTPFGAVPTGTEVTLRLEAALNDLEGVKLRVWDTKNNKEFLYDMKIAASTDTAEYWEYTLPASSAANVYWYRFIAYDGLKSAYYEDDDALTGGLGKAYADSPDRSWQLTVYDENFKTPDWMKNAVVYQIFPDRFSDGDPSNNRKTGDFFYGASDTIARSNTDLWNTAICDPRDNSSDCTGKYNNNFYGGDIRGIINKIAYIKGMGFNTLYINPVFESPSNHGYDTTDYLSIASNMGTEADFIELATKLHENGMYLIIDGVFNHVSSDSKYLDRYNRYGEVGACESPDSPYRSWFYFKDVAAGTGLCAGSDGTENAANYDSWWGYDSLPKLNATLPEVKQLIWDYKTANKTAIETVAGKWMQYADAWRLDVGGDVDPGYLSPNNNDYWEGFRDTVHTVKSDAYITGEEWAIANNWLVGGEWDAVMNYQFSSAVLSFWRDSAFTDNDHNSGSSAGELKPLSPTQLNDRLENLRERYAPEAFAAMLNLFDSHDTSRVLIMLDENAANANYWDPNYNWSAAIEKLKGAVLMQMTLPGAPTVYYGGEIGLVGPASRDVNGVLQDDPYNRQPYPWADSSGTPYYTHLQFDETGSFPANTKALQEYYAKLINFRNAHASLRTGDFIPVIRDDTNSVYAYLRNSPNVDSTAVIFNRSETTQTVNLPVAGIFANGGRYTNLFTGIEYTVTDGHLNAIPVPANSGVLLYRTNDQEPPTPSKVTDLHIAENTTPIPGNVQLAWSSTMGAGGYKVYRSELRGAAYEELAVVGAPSYKDTTANAGKTYYYVVTAIRSELGTESGYSNEVSANVYYQVGWANLQWPQEISDHQLISTGTDFVYGRVYIDGVTTQAEPYAGLVAELGYGPTDTKPNTSSWRWFPATYNAGYDNNDEYKGKLIPDTIGNYDYLYRYSTDNRATWVYGAYNDTFYASLDNYDPANAGKLSVIANLGDTVPTSAPILSVSSWNANSVSLSWTKPSETDLYVYDLYVSSDSGATYTKISRITDLNQTKFTHSDLTTGIAYSYKLVALDNAFNQAASNIVEQVAEARKVNLTIRVTVPECTPKADQVYIVGNNDIIGNWDPKTIPLTKSATLPDVWEISFADLLEDTQLEYKFTRGSWETVMKDANGNTELNNLSLTAAYGTDGNQVVENTVENWRDPILCSPISPANGSIDVAQDAKIVLTWNQEMSSTSVPVILVNGLAVEGEWSLSDSNPLINNVQTFTPAGSYPSGATVSIDATKTVDAGGDAVQTGAEASEFRVRDYQAPAKPVLIASLVTGDSITLAWEPVMDDQGVVGYEIYEVDTEGSTLSLVISLAGDQSSYLVTGLTPGTSYTYRLRAIDAAGNASDSEDKTVQTFKDPTYLYLPLISK